MENEVIHLSRKLRRENRFCQQERSAIQNAYLCLLRSAEVSFQHVWCLHAIRLLIQSTSREHVDEKELWADFCRLQKPNFKPASQCLSPELERRCEDLLQFLHSRPNILVNFLRFCEDSRIGSNSKTPSDPQWLHRMVFILFSSVFGFCQFPQDEDLLLLVFKAYLDTVDLSDIARRRRCLSGGGASAFSLLLRNFLENLPSARRYLIATLRDPILWLLQQDEWFYDVTHARMMDRFSADVIQTRFGENRSSPEFAQRVANFRVTVVQELVSMTRRFVDSMHRTAWLVPIPLRYLLCLADQNVARGEHQGPAQQHRVQLISELVFECFLSPAIVDPESFGIVGDISVSEYAKHNLMEVARILHQLFLNADPNLVSSPSGDSFSSSTSQPGGQPIRSSIPQSEDLFAHFTSRSLLGFLTSLSDCFSESFTEQSRTDIIDPKPTSEGLQCVGLTRATCLLATHDLNLLCNAFREFTTSMESVPGVEPEVARQAASVASSLPQQLFESKPAGVENGQEEEQIVLVFPFHSEDDSQNSSFSCPGMLPETQVIQMAMAAQHSAEQAMLLSLTGVVEEDGPGDSEAVSPGLVEDLEGSTPLASIMAPPVLGQSSTPNFSTAMRTGGLASAERDTLSVPKASSVNSNSGTPASGHHRHYPKRTPIAIMADGVATTSGRNSTGNDLALLPDKLDIRTRATNSSADDLLQEVDMEDGEVELVDDEEDDVASLPSCSSLGAHSAPGSVPCHSALGRGVQRRGASAMVAARMAGVAVSGGGGPPGSSLSQQQASRPSGMPPLSVSFAAVNHGGGNSSSSSSMAYPTQGSSNGAAGPSSSTGNVGGGGSSSVASSGKRTRFSISHDRESLYNVSDTQELTSEMAPSEITSIRSIPSMDMESQEGDALSDMFLSANVSGRGTPSISGGRDSPLSATGGTADLPGSSSGNPHMHKTADVTEKFGKFDIPISARTAAETEARSTVSDTWSTDVLASDSEVVDVTTSVSNLSLLMGLSSSNAASSTTASAARSSIVPTASNVATSTSHTQGSPSRLVDISEECASTGLKPEETSLNLAKNLPPDMGPSSSGSKAAQIGSGGSSQCSSSLSSHSALSHTSSPCSSPAMSTSYSAASMSAASSTQQSHTTHTTHTLQEVTTVTAPPADAPDVSNSLRPSSKSVAPQRRTTGGSRGGHLANHLPNFLHQAIRGATTSTSSTVATKSATSVSGTTSATSSTSKPSVLREGLSKIRERLSVKSGSGGSQSRDSTDSTSTPLTTSAVFPWSSAADSNVPRSGSAEEHHSGTESNNPTAPAATVHLRKVVTTPNTVHNSAHISGDSPSKSSSDAYGAFLHSSRSSENMQRLGNPPPSTAGTQKESVEEMLARYQRKTSSARNSIKVDPTKGSHNSAVLPGVDGPSVSGNMESGTFSSTTDSFYDSTRPQSSPAWLDAKRKLRMVLQNVTAGTAASSLALRGRETHANVMVMMGSGAVGASGTALHWINPLNQRDNALLRVLTAMLADAIQANEHYVCAQLQETIRVVSLFSPEVCQSLVRSMLADCRQRRHYTAYLIQTREQLAIAQDWLDSWIRQYQQSLRALSQYVCNEVCNQLLRQEHHSFVATVRTLSSFVEEAERRQLVQKFMQRIQRSLVRSVYHHPAPPSSWANSNSQMLDTSLTGNSASSGNHLLMAVESQLRQSVERSVFTALYPHTMYLDDWVAERERDQLFQRELQQMAQTTSYRFYGVPSYCLSVIPFESAQQELRLLNCYKSPVDKVACVKRVNDCIVHLLRMADHTVIPNADDVLPVLTFVIVQVNPKFLISNVKYVDMFYGDRLTGEDQYLWCQFCIAVEAIKKMLMEQQAQQ